MKNKKEDKTKQNTEKNTSKSSVFEIFASNVSKATGSTAAFTIALAVVIIWAITGPFFNYSEVWQLVINTGTTIITFLMVFLIQKVQNKDSLALHLKLNELVASSKYSSNRLVDIENMTEEEMVIVQKYYHNLSKLSATEDNLSKSHSIAESELSHRNKVNFSNKKKKH